jgi:hypothetical protein
MKLLPLLLLVEASAILRLSYANLDYEMSEASLHAWKSAMEKTTASQLSLPKACVLVTIDSSTVVSFDAHFTAITRLPPITFPELGGILEYAVSSSAMLPSEFYDVKLFGTKSYVRILGEDLQLVPGTVFEYTLEIIYARCRNAMSSTLAQDIEAHVMSPAFAPKLAAEIEHLHDQVPAQPYADFASAFFLTLFALAPFFFVGKSRHMLCTTRRHRRWQNDLLFLPISWSHCSRVHSTPRETDL